MQPPNTHIFAAVEIAPVFDAVTTSQPMTNVLTIYSLSRVTTESRGHVAEHSSRGRETPQEHHALGDFQSKIAMFCGPGRIH